MEFYISPQSGQFYMINVLENQWLSVTYRLILPHFFRISTDFLYSIFDTSFSEEHT